MTQEEKAKQYDEVLEKAKSWYVDAQIDFKKTLEALFPTIKENEDERVRKAIISGMKALQEKGKYTEFAHIPMDEVFTWLEKQGKKNLNDNVKPKFHEGDWIVFNGLTLYIKEVVNGYYRTISFDGINNSYDWDIDNIARLWTIQDARDGDVLCVKYGNDEIPFIFTGKQYDVAYCALNSFGEFVLSMAEWLLKVSVLPATKEQRDTLEKAMTDAGYTFDFEKKELKKIENDLTEFENTLADVCRGWIGEELGWKDYIIKNSLPLLEFAKKQFDEYEQKPSWSEEDDYNLQCIIAKVTYDIQKGNIGRNQELIDWLKSLKDRMNND